MAGRVDDVHAGTSSQPHRGQWTRSELRADYIVCFVCYILLFVADTIEYS